MSKYKAIVADIDGTITVSDPNSFPSIGVTKAVKKATQTGILFSLASGRPFFMVEYLIKHLHLTAPVITDNGAVIINSKDKSVLWEAVLPHEEALQIISLIKPGILTRISCDSVNLENPTQIPKDAKVRKVSIHDIEPGIADRLIKQIEEKFKNLSVIRAASYKGPHLVDVYISHAEATKQHAVFKYAQLLGISTDEIIGVGDGYNDFPLLLACGFKVAMGNAVPELKEIADYIAPSVEEDGLADVIEKYILS